MISFDQKHVFLTYEKQTIHLHHSEWDISRHSTANQDKHRAQEEACVKDKSSPKRIRQHTPYGRTDQKPNLPSHGDAGNLLDWDSVFLCDGWIGDRGT